uniref:Uncharacterized protein n=1 Tax=uncultured bacterium BLR5 TaxID=506522 RepID=C0INX0_9BACT|nr:hypothetical protein AKSOIL_0046 [uncultured bacterium BLR5]
MVPLRLTFMPDVYAVVELQAEEQVVCAALMQGMHSNRKKIPRRVWILRAKVIEAP